MKNKLLIFVILMLFLLPVNVFADESTVVSLTSCNKENGESVKAGDKITCELHVNNFTGQINNIEGIISYSGKAENYNFIAKGGNSEYKANEKKLTITNANFEGDNVLIGTFEFTISNDASDEVTSLQLSNFTVNGAGANLNGGLSLKVEETGGSETGGESTDDTVTIKDFSITNATLVSESNCGVSADNSCSYVLSSGTKTFALDYTLTGTGVDVSLKDVKGQTLDSKNITFNPDNQSSMLLVLDVGNIEYTINVIGDSSEEQNDDFKLSSLLVGGYNVDLDSCDANQSNDFVCSIKIDSIEDYSINTVLKNESKFKTEIDGLGNDGKMTGSVFIVKVVYKENSSNVAAMYTVNVEADEPELPVEDPEDDPVTPSSKEDPTPSGGNPDTGRTSIFIISIILILSFAASIYIYRKNISGYNN